MTTFTLINRNLANGTINGVTGATYAVDAAGEVTGVAQLDVQALLTSGFRMTAPSDNDAPNGLTATPVPLRDFRNTDGSILAAAAASGKFGWSITLGTSAHLVSEAANNNTKTDDAVTEYVLPANYIAGQNITVTVNASITGSGTLSTKTAQIKAYRTAKDGTQGSDIGPGAATAMTAAGADVAFAVTGTTLNPGDRLVFELETVLTETASSNMTANINSVRVS